MTSVSASTATRSALKRASFWAVLLLVPLCALEVISFVVTKRLQERAFSYEDTFFSQVRQDEFERFVSSPYFDPALGWNNPQAPTRAARQNCVGQTIEYHYEDGMRVTPGLAKGMAEVALFGESYTQGEDVADAFTIASVLTNQYAIPTANYGVNAYDPLQAAGKLETALPRLAGVKVVVLLVMHENIWRVVNSFKPVYFPYKNEFYFGLKPYVSGGRVAPLHYPTSYPDFLREARSRFRSDYWAKPERRFPFTLSLARGLASRSFLARVRARREGAFAYDYDTNEETRTALMVALDRFVTTADSAGRRPVVVFIPRFQRSYGVSARFVQAANQRWGREIAHEFVDGEMDWSRYKLSEAADYCHPSPYGYGRIALFLSKLLR